MHIMFKCPFFSNVFFSQFYQPYKDCVHKWKRLSYQWLRRGALISEIFAFYNWWTNLLIGSICAHRILWQVFDVFFALLGNYIAHLSELRNDVSSLNCIHVYPFLYLNLSQSFSNLLAHIHLSITFWLRHQFVHIDYTHCLHSGDGNNFALFSCYRWRRLFQKIMHIKKGVKRKIRFFIAIIYEKEYFCKQLKFVFLNPSLHHSKRQNI